MISEQLDKTARYWSEHTAQLENEESDLFWRKAGSAYYRYGNRQVSGSPDINWLQYTLSQHLLDRLPLTRCLSLGCGSGELERSLAELGVFQYCDAYDIADGSIHKAEAMAHDRGLTNITYRIADINQIQLSQNTYDAVWINHAMHHFSALEHICDQIYRALKPASLFILNDYIGPNRFQFSARRKEIANIYLHLLPSRYRVLAPLISQSPASTGEGARRSILSYLIERYRQRRLDFFDIILRRVNAYMSRIRGQDRLKQMVTFPSREEVIAVDPSEAIRSEEIVDVIERNFEIVEKKEWSGQIIPWVLDGILHHFSDQDVSSQVILQMLLSIEDALLTCGEFRSEFAYIVAQPMKKR
jgi:2-polyprenyl-3-methyl-5-hydroxy-6-metoxy-1,4-benzoquinol methylase